VSISLQYIICFKYLEWFLLSWWNTLICSCLN
jgi:hypothetical protein